MNQKSANKTKSKPSRERTANWDAALRLLKKKRLMTHAEFATMGISGVKLRRSTEAGEILSLGSGIYADVSIDPFTASVWAIAKYYPLAVISGFTALNIHGLSNEFIENIDVDIPRSASIRNKLLKVHRVAEKRIDVVIRLKYEGVSIRIYNIERSLCEAYRLDPAGSLFFRALKRYVALGKIRISKIQEYDLVANTKVLFHLRQELADW
ncbi:MAG: hypothetical protein RL189_2716 [Pseudomonadota bacterium]|jgi:hypothetical protein